MLGMGGLQMGGSLACAYDPFSANRTFFLRGDGVDGATPATDELGNALTWGSGASLSSVNKAWPTYTTAARQNQSPITPPTSKFQFGIGGAPFSIRIKLAIFTQVGPSSGMVLQTGNGAGSWGNIQSHIWLHDPGTISWQFAGSAEPSVVDIPSPGDAGGTWGDHAFHELLLTYDGTTTRGYYDGVKKGESTGTYGVRDGGRTRIGCDVDNGQSLYMAFNDFTIYNTCVTTANSYTLATQPPC